MKNFNYNEAFSRNIGWLTDWELFILKNMRIAIAGLGGVGGIHLLTLTRLGIENFSIADMDTFELANFNRQVGASCSSIGHSKVEIMSDMARDINPNINISAFDAGINQENIDAFF